MAAPVGRFARAEHVRSVWEALGLEGFEELLGNGKHLASRFDVQWTVVSMSVFIMREPVLGLKVLRLYNLGG